MVGTVLKWMAITTVIGLFLLWIATGGIPSVDKAASKLSNPIDNILSGVNIFGKSKHWGGLHLPWQPDPATLGFRDLTGLAGTPGEQSAEDEIADVQEQLDALERTMADTATFGTPSPYRGTAHIEAQSDPEAPEYLTLTADADNSASIDVTGWSFQSTNSGLRAYMPRGARDYAPGQALSQNDILLQPGEYATVFSGRPPLGTSLIEDGYWHIYLGSHGDLWHNEHDTIRLLDRAGRTIDALSY